MVRYGKEFRTLFVVLLISTAASVLILPVKARAIPAFARKYRMSCTTCHAPAPRLKAYGEDFAGNAFRLEEGQEPERYLYDTGDGILTLTRELPLAVRLDAFVQYRYRDEADRTDLQTPYGMKILSGGQISDKIGYYFYFYLSERGEVAGIEDAYVHFNDLFGIDLDLMVGQFQVSDPIFKRELRLTFEDYRPYTFTVGNSVTRLTYDRGFMLTYGAPFGLNAVLGLVNGSGKGEADDHGLFDSDDWKNFLVRLSQEAGPVRVGGFGYICNSVKNILGGRVENEHFYWGVDGTIDFGDRLQLNGQYLEREDDNPFFHPAYPLEVKTRGAMIEAVWAPGGGMGRSFLTLLYNYVDSKLGWIDYRSETLSYSYLLRRNLRLVAEATFSEEDEEWRGVAGFVSAF